MQRIVCFCRMDRKQNVRGGIFLVKYFLVRERTKSLVSRQVLTRTLGSSFSPLEQLHRWQRGRGLVISSQWNRCAIPIHSVSLVFILFHKTKRNRECYSTRLKFLWNLQNAEKWFALAWLPLKVPKLSDSISKQFGPRIRALKKKRIENHVWFQDILTVSL